MIMLAMWQLLLLISPFVLFGFVGVICWCVSTDRYDKATEEVKRKDKYIRFLLHKVIKLNGINNIKEANAYYKQLWEEYSDGKQPATNNRKA